MAITFRYDAAGIVPPSNESTRKYGQSLVLQQQQQKYAGQQAGYDRMFQWGRDNQQNAFQMGRDQRQNDFLIGRDKTQFDQQQQQAEAERQRKFMDDARKQSSGFIMDSIKNGEYDPATARKLQQNLVAESEALGNPNLDATQRAEALAKIRAERSMLSANRMEPPPKPTPQQQFDQGIVVGPDGMKYRANSKGDFEPLPVQPPQPAPPATAIDAFRADPKLQKQYIEDAVNVLTEGGMKPLTPAMRKQASALARELYDSDYGGSQSAPGQPTPGQPQQQTPSTSSLPFSGLRNAIGNVAGIAGQILSPPEQTQGSRAVATVDRADGRATYLNPDGTTTLGPVPEGPVESRPVAAVDRADGRTTYLNPDGTTALGPAPEGPIESRPIAEVARADGRTTYINPDGSTSLGPAPSASQPGAMMLLEGAQGGFTYQGTPEVNSYRAAQQPVNDWATAIEEQIASRGMNQQQIAAMNAKTDASLANTNALLADNQARGRAVADQYAPRTEGLRRDANVLQGRNARAESALRGELGPRSPGIDPSGPYSRDSQGKLYDGRVNRIYDISDEQDKRDQIVLDAMQADGDAYRARRDQRDAALQNRATNPIADPKQLKRDSAKFSADFQIYKKGGGSLSIRDYINQRAKQGTLSDDLKAQLQENYGMNLADEYVSQAVEQDLNGPRENAMAAAKSKRDAEENRKRRARGLPAIQQAPPVAAPDTTRPTRGLPGGEPTRPTQKYANDTTRPTRGLPGGEPTAPDMTRPTRGLPGGEPTAPARQYAGPDFGSLAASAKDDADRTLIGSLQKIYESQSPDIQAAIGVFVGPDSSDEDAADALAYLMQKGILIKKKTETEKMAERVYEQRGKHM